MYHRVLKTASYLKSWGLRISELCDLCSLVEDIDHVFFSCPVAVDVWEFVRPYISDLLGNFVVSPQFIFFSEFPSYVDNNAIKLSKFLIKLSLHQIWFYRCERRFGNKNCLSGTVIASICSLIRSRIQIVFKSTGKLNKELPLWSFRGVFCRIVNGRVFFNI